MKKQSSLPALLAACLLFVPSCAVAQTQKATNASWPAYGGDPGGTRFSPATQINKSNVSQLKVAWTFRTGALDAKTDLIRKAAFETTPILIEDKLFLSTQYDHVIALNPSTGEK